MHFSPQRSKLKNILQKNLKKIEDSMKKKSPEISKISKTTQILFQESMSCEDMNSHEAALNLHTTPLESLKKESVKPYESLGKNSDIDKEPKISKDLDTTEIPNQSSINLNMLLKDNLDESIGELNYSTLQDFSFILQPFLLVLEIDESIYIFESIHDILTNLTIDQLTKKKILDKYSRILMTCHDGKKIIKILQTISFLSDMLQGELLFNTFYAVMNVFTLGGNVRAVGQAIALQIIGDIITRYENFIKTKLNSINQADTKHRENNMNLKTTENKLENLCKEKGLHDEYSTTDEKRNSSQSECMEFFDKYTKSKSSSSVNLNKKNHLDVQFVDDESTKAVSTDLYVAKLDIKAPSYNETDQIIMAENQSAEPTSQSIVDHLQNKNENPIENFSGDEHINNNEGNLSSETDKLDCCMVEKDINDTNQFEFEELEKNSSSENNEDKNRITTDERDFNDKESQAAQVIYNNNESNFQSEIHIYKTPSLNAPNPSRNNGTSDNTVVNPMIDNISPQDKNHVIYDENSLIPTNQLTEFNTLDSNSNDIQNKKTKDSLIESTCSIERDSLRMIDEIFNVLDLKEDEKVDNCHISSVLKFIELFLQNDNLINNVDLIKIFKAKLIFLKGIWERFQDEESIKNKLLNILIYLLKNHYDIFEDEIYQILNDRENLCILDTYSFLYIVDSELIEKLERNKVAHTKLLNTIEAFIMDNEMELERKIVVFMDFFKILLKNNENMKSNIQNINSKNIMKNAKNNPIDYNTGLKVDNNMYYNTDALNLNHRQSYKNSNNRNFNLDNANLENNQKNKNQKTVYDEINNISYTSNPNETIQANCFNDKFKDKMIIDYDVLRIKSEKDKTFFEKLFYKFIKKYEIDKIVRTTFSEKLMIDVKQKFQKIEKEYIKMKSENDKYEIISDQNLKMYNRNVNIDTINQKITNIPFINNDTNQLSNQSINSATDRIIDDKESLDSIEGFQNGHELTHKSFDPCNRFTPILFYESAHNNNFIREEQSKRDQADEIFEVSIQNCDQETSKLNNKIYLIQKIEEYMKDSTSNLLSKNIFILFIDYLISSNIYSLFGNLIIHEIVRHSNLYSIIMTKILINNRKNVSLEWKVMFETLNSDYVLNEIYNLLIMESIQFNNEEILTLMINCTNKDLISNIIIKNKERFLSDKILFLHSISFYYSNTSDLCEFIQEKFKNYQGLDNESLEIIYFILHNRVQNIEILNAIETSSLFEELKEMVDHILKKGAYYNKNGNIIQYSNNNYDINSREGLEVVNILGVNEYIKNFFYADNNKFLQNKQEENPDEMYKSENIKGKKNTSETNPELDMKNENLHLINNHIHSLEKVECLSNEIQNKNKQKHNLEKQFTTKSNESMAKKNQILTPNESYKEIFCKKETKCFEGINIKEGIFENHAIQITENKLYFQKNVDNSESKNQTTKNIFIETNQEKAEMIEKKNNPISLIEPIDTVEHSYHSHINNSDYVLMDSETYEICLPSIVDNSMYSFLNEFINKEDIKVITNVVCSIMRIMTKEYKLTFEYVFLIMERMVNSNWNVEDVFPIAQIICENYSQSLERNNKIKLLDVLKYCAINGTTHNISLQVIGYLNDISEIYQYSDNSTCLSNTKDLKHAGDFIDKQYYTNNELEEVNGKKHKISYASHDDNDPSYESTDFGKSEYENHLNRSKFIANEDNNEDEKCENQKSSINKSENNNKNVETLIMNDNKINNSQYEDESISKEMSEKWKKSSNEEFLNENEKQSEDTVAFADNLKNHPDEIIDVQRQTNVTRELNTENTYTDKKPKKYFFEDSEAYRRYSNYPNLNKKEKKHTLAEKESYKKYFNREYTRILLKNGIAMESNEYEKSNNNYKNENIGLKDKEPTIFEHKLAEHMELSSSQSQTSQQNRNQKKEEDISTKNFDLLQSKEDFYITKNKSRYKDDYSEYKSFYLDNFDETESSSIYYLKTITTILKSIQVNDLNDIIDAGMKLVFDFIHRSMKLNFSNLEYAFEVILPELLKLLKNRSIFLEIKNIKITENDFNVRTRNKDSFVYFQKMLIKTFSSVEQKEIHNENLIHSLLDEIETFFKAKHDINLRGNHEWKDEIAFLHLNLLELVLETSFVDSYVNIINCVVLDADYFPEKVFIDLLKIGARLKCKEKYLKAVDRFIILENSKINNEIIQNINELNVDVILAHIRWIKIVSMEIKFIFIENIMKLIDRFGLDLKSCNLYQHKEIEVLYNDKDTNELLRKLNLKINSKGNVIGGQSSFTYNITRKEIKSDYNKNQLKTLNDLELCNEYSDYLVEEYEISRKFNDNENTVLDKNQINKNIENISFMKTNDINNHFISFDNESTANQFSYFTQAERDIGNLQGWLNKTHKRETVDLEKYDDILRKYQEISIKDIKNFSNMLTTADSVNLQNDIQPKDTQKSSYNIKLQRDILENQIMSEGCHLIDKPFVDAFKHAENISDKNTTTHKKSDSNNDLHSIGYPKTRVQDTFEDITIQTVKKELGKSTLNLNNNEKPHVNLDKKEFQNPENKHTSNNDLNTKELSDVTINSVIEAEKNKDFRGKNTFNNEFLSKNNSKYKAQNDLLGENIYTKNYINSLDALESNKIDKGEVFGSLKKNEDTEKNYKIKFQNQNEINFKNVINKEERCSETKVANGINTMTEGRIYVGKDTQESAFLKLMICVYQLESEKSHWNCILDFFIFIGNKLNRNPLLTTIYVEYTSELLIKNGLGKKQVNQKFFENFQYSNVMKPIPKREVNVSEERRKENILISLLEQYMLASSIFLYPLSTTIQDSELITQKQFAVLNQLATLQIGSFKERLCLKSFELLFTHSRFCSDLLSQKVKNYLNEYRKKEITFGNFIPVFERQLLFLIFEKLAQNTIIMKNTKKELLECLEIKDFEVIKKIRNILLTELDE